MRDEREQNEKLDRQIKELKEEIAKLSSLLALRKMESDHPHLEKLVNELAHARHAIKRGAGRIEDFGREHLGDISPAKGLGILGSIVVIGSVGYVLLSAFGILGHHRR